MFQISIKPEEIEKLEMKSFPGKITVIDSTGPDFTKAVAYLRRQKLLGFDTESRPSFSPNQPHYGVSLLQLSGPERAFLFRVKKTGIPKSLFRVLASPDIIKVGAAVADDVRGLQRIERFDSDGFYDLQKNVWEYGIRDKSVKKMAAIILGIRISKTQQLSNWEAENLSESQQKYAATDAWVCREMYLKLQKSEKNPLTPEQMMPAAPKETPMEPVNAGVEVKPVKSQLQPKSGREVSATEKRKKSHRSRHSRHHNRRRRKTTKAAQSND